MASCDILLAAFNGTKYGPALLDSLLAQTNQNFNLLVRDDGSTDDTVAMLENYRPKFGGRMVVVGGGVPTGSAQGNFSILMQHSQADYVMFADIDDVWLPEKVDVTLRLLSEAEDGRVDVPVFVFTDVVPVNAELKPLSDSYWKYKKIDPKISQALNQSLVCPPMLGCASGVNRALLQRITPVPAGVTGHDWWGLLVASTFGNVRYSSERTMLYRLHGSNQSNQKEVSFTSYAKTMNRVLDVRRGMERRRIQASELLRFDDMGPNERKAIERFVDIGRLGFLARRYSTIAGGYLYPDLPRNLAMLLGM